MTIDLVFITYNRLEYTKLSLASVLADPTEKFRLTIWDNASTDGTVEYLKNEVKDPRIVDIVFSTNNIGQYPAVNEVWGKSKADLLGKLDNDCLVTPCWTRTLAQAHADIPELGIVACWHYLPEEFDYERAKHKIQTFGRHQIFRHPWPDGTGLLFKRDTFERFGPIQKRMSKYWIKIASAGYINGYYFPLIYVEHMDSATSKHSMLHRMSFDEACKYSPAYQDGRVTNRKQLDWARKMNVENLLTGPYDPKYYMGWRRKLRGLKYRINRFLKCRKFLI
jgi:GT2 family glycosyltransferase